ncbi:MAG: hypothetical protein KJ607_11740, partial [Bacteroidetes bacterium]|nr:hypothetical protein [Bacteroidota bacterium]
MKANYLGIIIAVITFLLFASDAFSQPCKFRKSDCELEDSEEDIFGDYDYRSQSAYAQMSPGDVQEVRFVVYRGKDYQVFTCQDYDLGDVQFQIVKPENRRERIIKKVNEKEEKVYKTDEYGSVIYKYNEWGDMEYDEEGNPIPEQVLGTKKIYDTIWEVKEYTEEVVWFDSHNNKDGTKRWKLQNVQK